MDRLKDRVAIVTGAASGIGRAVAQRFHDEGALVFAVDRNAETLGRLPAIRTDGPLTCPMSRSKAALSP